MKDDTFLAADRGDFLERKDHAGFVIRPHHRDDRGIRPDRAFDVAGLEMTFLVDLHDRDVAAVFGGRLAIIQDRVVLDRSRHHMPPVRRHVERGMQRGVVRFRSAARENNFLRLAPEQRRDAFVRDLRCVFDLRAETMRARRIAVALGQERHHFFEHRRVYSGAGIVVEIDDFGRVHRLLRGARFIARVPRVMVRPAEVKIAQING